jgi:hypothetical protein
MDRVTAQASQLGPGFIAFGVQHTLHRRDDEGERFLLLSANNPTYVIPAGKHVLHPERIKAGTKL